MKNRGKWRLTKRVTEGILHPRKREMDKIPINSCSYDMIKGEVELRCIIVGHFRDT